MSNQNIYSYIMSKLRATRRKESWMILGSGMFYSASIIFSFLLIAVFIEAIMNGDIAFRTFLAYSLAIISLISLGYFLYPGLARFLVPRSKPALNTIALRVGEKYPDVKDRLSNAVQIFKTIDNPGGMSAELIEAAFSQITSSSKDKDFDVIINRQNFKRSFLMFITSFVLFWAMILLFPSSLGSSLNRVVNWNESFLPPAPFSLQLLTQDATVLRGKAFTIKVKANGEAPEKIKLMIKEEQQKEFDEFVLTLDSGNLYEFNIASAKTSMIFYAKADWLSSTIVTTTGKMHVIDLPQIRSLVGKVTYPSYTQLGNKEFNEMNADISALAGSTVSLQISANKPIKSAVIILEKSNNPTDSSNTKVDSTIVGMRLSDKTASGSFKVNFNGTYHISITDKDGNTNPDPIKYSVVTSRDDYPMISMLSPMVNVEVGKDALLPIKVAISDDYGFKSLKLHYRMTESKYAEPQEKFRAMEIPIGGNELSKDVAYVWDLNKLGITPDDKYEYYLEVFDNDIVSGPKSSRTQTLSLRLPSMDEISREADNIHDKVDKELKNILKESEALKKDMEELNRELLKKNNEKEMNWKEKKSAEDIMKKQAELKDKMKDVAKQIEDATNKLQENNMLSPETLQKYMELQKLMQDVKSPELEKMQREMENAMKSMSEEQMQKAMKEAKFDEEKFRKNIERTMKILKRMQAEQKADALSKRAEEMERRQEELEKQMQNTNPNDSEKRKELAQKQDMLRKELSNINKDMKELENLMKEIGEKEMPMSDMKKAQDDLNFDETSSEMQEASESMQSGDFEKAKKNQRKSARKMSQLSQNMKDLKKKMQDKVSKEAQRKMQKALNDMLETSKNQEKLRNKTQKSDYNSTQVPQFAQDQSSELESMANIANSMMELAEKSFAVTPQMGEEMANAMRSMQSSVEFLANRQMSQAAQAQLEAMKSMNSTIGQMQSMLSQMNNQNSACDQGGGSGQGKSSGQSGAMSFQQRLQQLAAQQQAINQGLQQMSGGENGTMSQEQRAQMGRLADKQGGAQKSLEELAKEQKEFVSGDKMALGDLNKLAQEMKEVAQDIRSGRITEETKRKQEKILSRLLDATKSLHDRDFESKREGQSGKDYSRQSPGSAELDALINKNQAMQDLMNNLKLQYSKDYENLIRKYFEALREDKNATK